jgi:hypothetical protein
MNTDGLGKGISNVAIWGAVGAVAFFTQGTGWVVGVAFFAACSTYGMYNKEGE